MRKMAEGLNIEQQVEDLTNDPDYDPNHVMDAGYESEVLVSGDSGDDSDGDSDGDSGGERRTYRRQKSYKQYHPEDMNTYFKFTCGLEFTSLIQFKDVVNENS